MFARTEADCRHLSAIAAEERTRAKVQQMNIRPGQSEASVETIMICVKIKEKKRKKNRKNSKIKDERKERE